MSKNPQEKTLDIHPELKKKLEELSKRIDEIKKLVEEAEKKLPREVKEEKK
jgi:mRNA-degrading endonuclease RelE of RelBE toxin-antitoxin system